MAENVALILRVFLPFVTGYYVAYLFRSINAVMALPLATELGLGAGDLGLLTSVYFLTFAAAQIPIGILLDRYGPRRVQSALMVVAALGSTLFAVSGNFSMLLLGRALIGLGVAAALTAGMQALVLWFPRERVPLLNGLMVMLGALGAVTATWPAELLLASIGWRELFGLFAALTAVCAILVYFVVPEATPARSKAASVGLKKVYGDPRFWRLAPLSASCIGTAWALQGLWAAQWFADVDGFDRAGVVRHLFMMAIALSVWCHRAGHRCRSAPPTRRRTGNTAGAGRDYLYRNSVGADPAVAFAVLYPVERCSGDRRGDRAKLRHSGRVFPEGVDRAGQRGAESVSHRRRIRRAICDRRRGAAMDPRCRTLSGSGLSDRFRSQCCLPDRRMDLVHDAARLLATACGLATAAIRILAGSCRSYAPNNVALADRVLRGI